MEENVLSRIFEYRKKYIRFEEYLPLDLTKNMKEFDFYQQVTLKHRDTYEVVIFY